MSVRDPSVSSYHDKSLRPPPEGGDAEEDEKVSWDWGEALIDYSAYMIDENNHTSACSPFTTMTGKPEQLQVTFCLNPPPHVSYFCVAYTSGERTRFIREPVILATEGNLALIGVNGDNSESKFNDYNFFVYHAPIRGHESPRLELLPHPDPDLFPWNKYCYFTQGEVGILRYRTNSGSKQQAPFTPPTLMYTHALARRHKHFTPYTNKEEEYDAYKIATLYTRFEESGTAHYDLFIYDSKNEHAWTREPTIFPHGSPPSFFSDKVLTIAGTMVWVDLSQGIILCDDLHVPPEGGPRQLRYIQLPKPVQTRINFPLCVSTASFFRDIAIVEDRIKFVDLEIHDSSPGLYSWTALTWSISVGDSEFHKDGEVKSADIASSGASLDLRSLFVAHPTLSSHHGDILYLMAKPSLALRDREATVIAVDMKNKKMERVAKYTTQRTGSMDFAYVLTTISKYLAPPGDSKASIRKRRPASLVGSSLRKAPAFTSKSGVQVEEEDHSKMPASMDDQGDNMATMDDHGDNMDLE